MNPTLTTAIRKLSRRGLWASSIAAGALLFAPAAAWAQEASTPQETAAQAGESLRNVAQPVSGQLYASPAQVRMVQQKLKEQDRLSGEADGVWDEALRAEIRKYQEAKGLAPTGQIDTTLLTALDMGGVLEGRTGSEEFLGGLLRSDAGGQQDAARDQGAARGAPLYVSPAHVAQIQHLLQQQGFYEGPIDGLWGEGTAGAANKYRQARGLEEHAGLDVALLRSLNQQAKSLPALDEKVASVSAGVPLQAGPGAIRALQRELSAAGHEAGDVDGVWGENTRAAVRDFQREHELETTGTLTLPTLAALGMDVAKQAGQATGDFEAQAQQKAREMSEEAEDAVATAEDAIDDLDNDEQ